MTTVQQAFAPTQHKAHHSPTPPEFQLPISRLCWVPDTIAIQSCLFRSAHPKRPTINHSPAFDSLWRHAQAQRESIWQCTELRAAWFLPFRGRRNRPHNGTQAISSIFVQYTELRCICAPTHERKRLHRKGKLCGKPTRPYSKTRFETLMLCKVCTHHSLKLESDAACPVMIGRNRNSTECTVDVELEESWRDPDDLEE